ncbi:MAG: DUF2924 domain-containing protein [Holosporaceae bacterium]|jgi:hypothetical protein|nr:DUF2924 domain-containing protein [Holosporaceae bacterium]
MNQKIFSIISKGLDLAADQAKKSRTSGIPSVSDQKIVENLCRSSKYEDYVRDNSINEVILLMSADKDLLYSQIAQLSTLSTTELRALWKSKFGTDAPSNARRTTLLDNLSYHFREIAFGGLSDKAQERLEMYEERFKSGKPLLDSEDQLPPGTILTREHGGKRHVVKILEGEKAEYNGEVYNSLSAVARAITGTRWNGWKFFHIEKRA